MSDENTELQINCPHCQGLIIVIKLNCHIFRHGIYKNNGQQINPHAPKNVCDELVKNDLIFGCGKPFLIKKEKDEYVSIICDYI